MGVLQEGGELCGKGVEKEGGSVGGGWRRRGVVWEGGGEGGG